MVGYEYMRHEESDGDGAAIKRMTKIVPWTKEQPKGGERVKRQE